MAATGKGKREEVKGKTLNKRFGSKVFLGFPLTFYVCPFTSLISGRCQGVGPSAVDSLAGGSNLQPGETESRSFGRFRENAARSPVG